MNKSRIFSASYYKKSTHLCWAIKINDMSPAAYRPVVMFW